MRSPAYDWGWRPGARLHDLEAPPAEGTHAGIPRGQVDREQRRERHVQAGGAAAAVDERRGPDDLCAGRARNIHRFPGRQPGRDDVLDHYDALARREAEPAPQEEPAVLPFGEYGPDSESARNLMTDDHAPERW